MEPSKEGSCYRDSERTVSPSKNLPCTESRIEEATGNPSDCLSRLHKVLREPIPENPSAKYIADTAQTLVDTLNEKRKNDNILLDHFREALEAQTQKILERVQNQLYETYETQSMLVDQKLHNLFACLDRVNNTEGDLQNFREQLKVLFQEIHIAN